MKYPSSVAITGILTAVFLAMVSACQAQEVLPRPEPPFKGHIGPTVQDSTLDFPSKSKLRKERPTYCSS
jgi:hypothetical protein